MRNRTVKKRKFDENILKQSAEDNSMSKRDEIEIDEVICNKIKSWLQYNETPFEEVRTKWQQTTRFRLNILKTTSSTSSIITDWPLYKHASLGPLLVSKYFYVQLCKCFSFHIF